ncbi:CheR family methyltransferase [Telmatospirillum siberiense]|uniref:Chemotaxis protein methyltransferase n=1 Tax=Telmatospirillum siberiense TaxID=382514 RepID=A0A2N3Q1S3_9PROT|nr:protein-glutamate O-methyltransferase CheR [Telmatospirillum siberiense]PKU26610.1 chemotaxis protein [Telmatospirillum siberiense]
MAALFATRQKDPSPAMTDEEYAKFCEFFYRKTGIQFQAGKKYFVDRRVADRIEKTCSESFRDYFTMVRFQVTGEELQFLVNAMTVNETYFFREDYQFDALIGGILPEVARSKRRNEPIRIWSIPCSSGEEPYSIAISILERWSQADSWNIEISASDIDSKILHEARTGLFGERSVSRVSAQLRSKYFLPRPDGSFQICDELRESIDFSLVNVVNPLHTHRFRDIDVIFCRNLLIYFDDVGRRETVEMFFDALSPGGFVCLGHSESMSRMSSIFLPRKFGETIVYQKPLSAE